MRLARAEALRRRHRGPGDGCATAVRDFAFSSGQTIRDYKRARAHGCRQRADVLHCGPLPRPCPLAVGRSARRALRSVTVLAVDIAAGLAINCTLVTHSLTPRTDSCKL